MTVAVPKDAVLRPGSLILITGVTSMIGSHVADQLLKRGFRVRGVVRDVAKAAWLDELFTTKYDKGMYEVTHVPDLSVKGCFDEGIKDVNAVVHTATVISFNPDPALVIPDSVAFALNAITAAVSTPSVKRFVFTSSSAAVNISIPNNPLTLTTSTWNDAAVQASKAPGPYGPDRIISTYSASKVLAERAVYEYAEANDQFTDLVVNSVLPDFCTGLPLDPAHMGMPSSAGLTKAVFEGEMDYARILGPQYWVNTLDVALLHIAGLLSPSANSERIFAYAGPKNWNDVLAIFRKCYSDRNFPEDDPHEGREMTTVEPKARAEALLKWVGKDHWTSMVESFREVPDYLIMMKKRDSGVF